MREIGSDPISAQLEHKWGRTLLTAAFEGGGLLALATLLLYAWLASAHIVDGDNAEFATLGAACVRFPPHRTVL